MCARMSAVLREGLLRHELTVRPDATSGGRRADDPAVVQACLVGPRTLPRQTSVIYVARSSDDGHSWSPFVPVTTVEPCRAAAHRTRPPGRHHRALRGQSDLPGHLYLTYEDRDGAQFDLELTE